MEIAAYNSYNEIDYEINFWRTKSGLEVDFVLGGGEVAIEVKGSTRIEKRDLQPLNAFIEEYLPRKALVVCNEREEIGGQAGLTGYLFCFISFLMKLIKNNPALPEGNYTHIRLIFKWRLNSKKTWSSAIESNIRPRAS